ncbi:peptidylprolyl isomerase [Novosphingobium sp. HBC54]|uniref:peptidylprolyl isomerase n=1 Tax=Novosphingobium cyanobacteriorum TaxID=3024215 RepID=A0ABT6CPM1_9SPHN|nr:peptidylprolyl isomerase [Novosphingobium cyanobacteriorum]MDF8335871.1 peptidylprolyl isomerase [Novosphingobium cyanobacteriorum]
MRSFLLGSALALSPALTAFAETPARPATAPAPSPAEIVAASPAADWTAIAPADLLVMDLAADAAGKPRRVVIQLLPPPFSQGWIGNIRTLAAAHWWDGTSINRAQDGYVVQWGDPDGEDKARAKPLPPGMRVVPQSEYEAQPDPKSMERIFARLTDQQIEINLQQVHDAREPTPVIGGGDNYALATWFIDGWPVASKLETIWPTHCYGTVGVGRDMPPDTGSGAELYAVIGHAPRQLDRNIAVIGRVIEGMEHLSTLPRGTGDIGFYRTAAERTPIRAIRIGADVPGLPTYEYLSTTSASFARYADARANRRDPFYIRPAGGVDICNVPVPVRRRQP